MGEEGAANILLRGTDNPEEKVQWKKEYRAAFLTPYRAAARGQVDDVILPGETRKKLLAALDMLQAKKRAIVENVMATYRCDRRRFAKNTLGTNIVFLPAGMRTAGGVLFLLSVTSAVTGQSVSRNNTIRRYSNGTGCVETKMVGPYPGKGRGRTRQ